MFSLKPLAKLRKKSATFRQKLSKRASIVSSAFSASTSFQIEPNFTIDNFLARLQESQSSMDSGIHSTTSSSTVSGLPLSLETIPMQCFKRILSYLPGNELPALRTVNKYFDATIQREHGCLQKIEVDTFHVTRVSSSFNIVRVGANDIESELPLCDVDRPLRLVHTRQICFYRITFTPRDIRYWHRAFAYTIVEMKFIECCFKVNSTELSIMMNHWKLSSLEFHNCEWNEDVITEFNNFIIDDRFITMNYHLDFLCFDFSLTDEKVLGFTDKLGLFFSNRPMLPSGIIFNNCRSYITSKTLYAAVYAYLESRPTDRTHFYMWSFGKISETQESVLEAIGRLPVEPTVQTISRNGRLEFTFNAGAGFPPLHMIVDLRDPEVQECCLLQSATSSEKATIESSAASTSYDDIDWDDDDDDFEYSDGTLDLPIIQPPVKSSDFNVSTA